MNFIFSTGSLWNYGLGRCFELAAQAGFDGIELMVDQRWDTRQAASIQALIDRHHLPVVAVHSPFLPAPGWPEDPVGKLKQSVELAEDIGAHVVVHHLPMRVGIARLQAGRRSLNLPIPGWSPEETYRHWLEDDYQGYQEKTAVRLCIENMPCLRRFGRRTSLTYWNTPAEMLRFDHITLDTTHLGTWGLEPTQVLGQLGGRVEHIHLSNFDGREHRLPEDGELRLDRFLAQLIDQGYAGVVSLELHPDALEAGQSDEHVLALLSGSLDYCRERAIPAGNGRVV